ncbi:MAG: hypothetical protein V2I57_00645 [Xanthomonadales bacterium]|nr:hypothetical protein [Xanthomonadales bacterium]
MLILGLAAPSLARECAFSETKLRSQSDVDEFQLNFLTQTPWVRCTVLVGSLVVEQEPGAGDDFEDPITSLAGLDDIVEVRGQLAIVGNPRLESLEGLENLRRVDGRFGVAHNRALKNLDALSALELVTDLNVGFNRELTNLDGLTGLRLDPDVDHSLVIEGNPRLQSVAGLAGLRGELRWLWITSNDQLDSFAGFEGIT